MNYDPLTQGFEVVGSIDFDNANQVWQKGQVLLQPVPAGSTCYLNLAQFLSANTVSVAVFSLWASQLDKLNGSLKLSNVSPSLQAILHASHKGELIG